MPRARRSGLRWDPGRGFRKGFAQKDGLTVFTNFRLHETRTPYRISDFSVPRPPSAQSQTT